LTAAHHALAVAEIRDVDFAEVTKNLEKGDFAYFDPPYMPVSKTANFTAYSSPFGAEEQARQGGGAPAQEGRALHTARSINSDVTKRGTVKELGVTTYDETEQSKQAVPARPVRRLTAG